MDFFVYRYVPSPKTIWLNVEKVEPAQYVVIDLKTFTKTKVYYWKLTDSKEKVGKEVFSSDFRKEFQQSVQEHLRADVPVGSFLSGGYDSSAIVLAAAQTDKHNDLKTFTVGFESWDQSEDQFAEQLCEQLAVSNKKVRLSDESLGLLERMPDVYDEPIADISIVPTYAVSQLARTDRKAVLSGEGADELFLGYHWQKEWVELNHFHLKNIFRTKPNLKSFYAQSMSMGEFNRDELTSMFTDSFRGAVEDDVHWFYQKHMRSDLSPIKAIQYLDVKCFMGELVLTKIDRASMANSLEVRVPFLKHTFFETLFKHDPTDYFQKGVAKFPIHSFLKNQIPENLLQRKKQGFVGPDAYYMNHDYYRKELLHSTLIEDGIIRREYIEKQLEIPYNWRLWKIVVFEKWYARWRKEISN
jgi:asparagine synthase (glutamine-hydrolysing)